MNITEESKKLDKKEFLNESDIINKFLEKITRFEVINHAKNDKKIGRLITMYKNMDFNTIETSIQDNGKTLKIFLD